MGYLLILEMWAIYFHPIRKLDTNIRKQENGPIVKQFVSKCLHMDTSHLNCKYFIGSHLMPYSWNLSVHRPCKQWGLGIIYFSFGLSLWAMWCTLNFFFEICQREIMA